MSSLDNGLAPAIVAPVQGNHLVALVSTVAYLVLEARAVEVQCQIAPGLPKFNVVGLPDKAVGESRERVHAALAAGAAAQADHDQPVARLPAEGRKAATTTC